MKLPKTPKKEVSVKIKALKGQFFDIKPAQINHGTPLRAWVKDYSRFALIAFVAFVLLILASTYTRGRDVVFESSEMAYAGYDQLQQGVGFLIQQDSQKAHQAFADAQATFEGLEDSTAFLTTQADTLITQNLYLDTADTLLDTAILVSDIGQQLADFMQSMQEVPERLLNPEAGDLIAFINEKKEALDTLKASTIELQQNLANVDVDLLPESLVPQVEFARQQVGAFLGLLLDLDAHTDQLLTLMGDEQPHHYLILFQNNDELRATGGFVGSYMLVDVNDGQITKMETRDIYETDRQFTTYLDAPPGISELTERWFMRDANYSPDFPTTAKQLMWFLEHSRGPSVDTVIAITPTPVEDALKLTGGIELEGLSEPLTAENFTQVISLHTEAKIGDPDRPKTLLFQMIPRFKEELAQLEQAPALLELMSDAAQGGHLQIYSTDEGVQAMVQEYGLSGAMMPAQENVDYLSVISTSIGGNKSDQFVETDVNHRTTIGQTGSLVNELRIQKNHTFDDEDWATIRSLVDEYGTGELDEAELFSILGEGLNRDYMRVYVPKGSVLKEVEGIEMTDVDVSEDLGYTVFGFLVGPTAPGDSNEVKFTYQLPFDLDTTVDHYRFVAENQAGAEQVTLNKYIEIPDTLKLENAYPQQSGESGSIQVLQTPFDSSQLFVGTIVASSE